MLSLDEATVDAAAPNAEASKNGRGLVLKNKFTRAAHLRRRNHPLWRMPGQRQGAVSLLRAISPRPRSRRIAARCPSRQFPCKHCLGLMYAYVQRQEVHASAPCRRTCRPSVKRCRRASRRSKADDDKPKQVNRAPWPRRSRPSSTASTCSERLTQRPGPAGHRQHERQARPARWKSRPSSSATPICPCSGGPAQLHQALRRRGRQVRRSNPRQREADLQRSARPARPAARPRQARVGRICSGGSTTRSLAPETDSAIAAWLGHAWQLARTQGGRLWSRPTSNWCSSPSTRTTTWPARNTSIPASG